MLKINTYESIQKFTPYCHTSLFRDFGLITSISPPTYCILSFSSANHPLLVPYTIMLLPFSSIFLWLCLHITGKIINEFDFQLTFNR